MNGKDHRAFAAGAFILTAPFMPLHGPKEFVAAGIVSVASSSGKLLSPDMDGGWLFRLVDKLIPDEKILDDNGPMRHRGITHWWLWPLLFWWLSGIPWDVWVSVDGHALTISSGWLLASLAVGWGSHVGADFIAGEAGQGRAAGVPLLGWRCHVGLGFDCDGLVAKVVARGAVPVAVVAAAWLALFPGVLPVPSAPLVERVADLIPSGG